MENSTAPAASTTSIAIRYGLLAGLVMCLLSFVIRLLFTDPANPVNNVIYLALIAGIILAHKDYKRQHQGFMSFGQGLGLGLLIALVAGVVSGLFSYVYAEFIDPESVTNMIEGMRAKMETEGRSQDQIDTSISWMQKMMTGPFMIATVILGVLFWGLIISLVASAFTKHNRPEFE
ncbi:DUF4199 domain-containing protein [Hymenobacter lucidus]|uniref:DUF4199 domain-containing protein n=1 Tax=Hymenobacter lucidus TaxID=2880930 RepID=A0ABS8AZH9_9BACT|nr:DUF4199 domain-containing protein [Hymenobacter lucidus]MCB2411173.1 DUF4199 domain-containing protein [Hymenobacter lucidus]